MRYSLPLTLVSISFLSITVACGRTSSSLETLPLSPSQLSYVRKYAKPPATATQSQVNKLLKTMESIKTRIARLAGSEEDGSSFA